VTARRGLPLEAAAFVVGAAAFGLAAHRPGLWPVHWGGIALALAALCRGVARHPRSRRLMGLTGFPAYRWAYAVPAAAFGAALAVAYRLVRGQTPLPSEATGLVALATVIGLSEELGYRGFVQGGLRPYGLWLACAAAAAGHAAYKVCLLALPAGAVRADLVVLGALTLGVGFVFGLMREAWGSLLFPAVAHAAFDVVAYADLARRPWWM